MRITCAALAIAALACPRPARAGCQFWSFSDGSIDHDKDISGQTGTRPLVRFYLVCNDSLADYTSLDPGDIGSDAHSISPDVPLMVAAHGGGGNLNSFRRGVQRITYLEKTYLMVYPQGVCDGDTGDRVVSVQRQTQTYNFVGSAWPDNIVTSCTQDLDQPTESPLRPNPNITSTAQQSQFEWRSVKSIDGDPNDQEYSVGCVGGLGSPCGSRLDDYDIPSIGKGVDARYAESDEYAYRDLRTIAGIVDVVVALYYPRDAQPKRRFLGFSSGAGLGLTILRYRNDLFDGYALAGHPVPLEFVQALALTPYGGANVYYDAAHFTDLGFAGYPLDIGGSEGTIASNTFDLVDVGDGHDAGNRGTANGVTLGNLDPRGINKKILFVQGSMDMVNLLRITRADPTDADSAGYDQPAAGDALPSPANCGATVSDAQSTAWIWQRYVNHTAQFLDTTAGATTPAILDQLTCGSTGWASVPSPPILTPTSTPATCTDFGYPSCGGDAVNTNYVYEFGGGNIKMIIPATGGHSFPQVTKAGGGAIGGVASRGNEIRDFSLAQEACIWFGDGCVRDVYF